MDGMGAESNDVEGMRARKHGYRRYVCRRHG